MSRTLKVMGNHVMYDRGAWFLSIITSSSRALCLPSVKKQNIDFQVCFVDRARHRKIVEDKHSQNTKRSTKVAKELFVDNVKQNKLREPFYTFRNELLVLLTVVTIFFRSMFNKTIIRFSFCDIQNIEGLSKGCQLQPITPTSTLIILDITKTSSNNCLLCHLP